MNILSLMKEKTELAKTYAQDGAFHSAARILRDLSDSLRKHADDFDRALWAAEKTRGRSAELQRLVNLVSMLHRLNDPDSAIKHLVEKEGARHRFHSGTHELRLGGIAGTCTSGGNGTLESWLRAARRKLARVGQ